MICLCPDSRPRSAITGWPCEVPLPGNVTGKPARGVGVAARRTRPERKQRPTRPTSVSHQLSREIASITAAPRRTFFTTDSLEVARRIENQMNGPAAVRLVVRGELAACHGAQGD